jgi:DnaJ-class molecular chaperone
MFFIRTDKDKKLIWAECLIQKKYSMRFCPDWKGKGKIPKDPDGFNVCSRCGGSGVIRKKRSRSG